MIVRPSVTDETGGTPHLLSSWDGAALTRHLSAAGVQVIEVNRPDRRSRRLRGKSDPLDAENAAPRALSGEEDIVPNDTTTTLESIRVLRIVRTEAIKARTAAFNQLKDLLITAPDSIRDRWRGKTLHRVSLEAARTRPDADPTEDPSTATRLALRSLGRRSRSRTRRSPSWTSS